jgi:hypothetical protein
MELLAQKTKKKTTRLSIEFFKNNDKQESLVATLRVRDGRYLPLAGVGINFYTINDSSKILLGNILTDLNGKAAFDLAESEKVFRDSTGTMNFEVDYEGDSEISSSSKSIAVKQADLAISFIKVDTVKSIEVSALEGFKDKSIPIEDLDVSFFIQGTFSLYNIGKDKTNERGIVRVDFPDYMPGDTAGVMTIVAKVEDDKAYGNIEVRDQINWGIPVPLPEVERRGLGDTDAPLWMVYTLIILLSAVWFHYLYVVFLIIRIKLARKA